MSGARPMPTGAVVDPATGEATIPMHHYLAQIEKLVERIAALEARVAALENP